MKIQELCKDCEYKQEWTSSTKPYKSTCICSLSHTSVMIPSNFSVKRAAKLLPRECRKN